MYHIPIIFTTLAIASCASGIAHDRMPQTSESIVCPWAQCDAILNSQPRMFRGTHDAPLLEQSLDDYALRL